MSNRPADREVRYLSSALREHGKVTREQVLALREDAERRQRERLAAMFGHGHERASRFQKLNHDGSDD